MLLKEMVHCTISSYRWPNHSRYVWLNYQISAVHNPHWQGSIKKNGTRTRKVRCNFDNSLFPTHQSQTKYFRQTFCQIYFLLQIFSVQNLETIVWKKKVEEKEKRIKEKKRKWKNEFVLHELTNAVLKAAFYKMECQVLGCSNPASLFIFGCLW